MQSNLIYKRQFAILLFIMSFTYKVSKLPSLVVGQMSVGGTHLIALYLVLEIFMFFIIYRYILTEGRDSIENTPAYKCITAVLAVSFLFKLMLMFTGTMLFAIELLFENISAYEVALTLIIPVTYLAYRGIRVISRSAELCFWLFAGVLIINLVFLKANPQFSNNLPLVSGSFAEFVKSGDKFFFWFGDFTPFVFLTLKSSKRNYVGLSLVVSTLLILLCYVLTYALYGAGAEYISNFIVKLAGFNQFASKLGRLDWTGMIVWLIMSVLYLAVYLWAFAEAAKPLLKKRNVSVLLGAAAVLAVTLSVKDVTKIVEFAMGDVRWLAVVTNYILPVALLILSVIKKGAHAKREMPTEVAYEQNA